MIFTFLSSDINNYYKNIADFLPSESVIEVAIIILGFFSRALAIFTLCKTSYLTLAVNSWLSLFSEVSFRYYYGICSLSHTLVFWST